MWRQYTSKTSSIVTSAPWTESPGFTITVPTVSGCINNACTQLLKYGKTLVYGPTAEEVTQNIDLTGKTCLITGGTSGIGQEMIRVLILRKCNVIMACRNVYAASGVSRKIPNSEKHLKFIETNLSSLASVKRLSDRLIKEDQKIDILLLNAAVFGLPWNLTEDGLEQTFQINYLSQYYLLQNIENLLPDDARIVIMSTDSHRNINLEYDYSKPLELSSFSLPEDKYTSIKAYNLSKFCGIMAMHTFAYRWSKINSSRAIFCVHPGSFVKTNLSSSSELSRNWWVWDTLYTSLTPFTKTIAQAAATPVYCCTAPELAGVKDVYYKDFKVNTESDLAKDVILAYKVDGLTKGILEEKVKSLEQTTEISTSETEESALKEELAPLKDQPAQQEMAAVC